MSRFFALAFVAVVGGGLGAAPVPPIIEARVLVARLSDPADNVRDQAALALRNRPDARPWLRRAARSADKDTARRAVQLLGAPDRERQNAATQSVKDCIRDRRADLFIEWHHFWQPAEQEDLWPVGSQMAKAGMEAYEKAIVRGETNYLTWGISSTITDNLKARYHDGPIISDRISLVGGGYWSIRTDQLTDCRRFIIFASVAGHIRGSDLKGGYFFALGPVDTGGLGCAVVVCDGAMEGFSYFDRNGDPARVRLSTVSGSIVVCRGYFRAQGFLAGSMLLVEGDVEILDNTTIKNCLIRATGNIHIPKDCKQVNSAIEPNVKNATAPYKFFELADVGVSLADDEEGLVVTAVKANTSFGNCGLAKGDLIRAIDDAPAGHSEEFRKAVRRALVRQGDCLLTVTRGDKTVDLPVFFPLPK